MKDNPGKSQIKNSLADVYRFMGFVCLFLLAIYIGSGIFSISQNQLGILQRFGKAIDSSVPPGIHYALPWPIDKVSKVPIREIRRIFIDSFSKENEKSETFFLLTGLEPYCVSGDNNILNVSFVIQYIISDPACYLFKTRQPDKILRDMACNAMMYVLVTLPVEQILTYRKQEIENKVRRMINQNLKQLNLGIDVSYVELIEVLPPRKVQDYFDDVVNAKIDQQRLFNEAESYQNEKLLEAKGKTHHIIEEAHAYKQKVTADAEGEAQRFLKQLSAYRGVPAQIRHRLWLEFISECFSMIDQKYILNSQDGKVSARLRLLQSN